ncbi:MAG: DUF1592 domain-containing protein [Lentisphaeraceae bacterium]|nr:DUF1592 domain-containing protein [Lentisphaeraceae bacterium]
MKFFIFGLIAFITLGAAADPRIDYIKKFTSRYCADCHDEDLEKGGLDITHYNLSLDTLEEERMWSNSYDRVMHKEMPPKKKKKQPSANELAAFKKNLTSLLNESVVKTQKSYGRTLYRRITREEYENTLRDLFELPQLKVKDMLPEDQSTGGYDNVTVGQNLSRMNIQSYMDASEYAIDMATTLGPKPTPYKYEATVVDYHKHTKKHKHKRPKDNGWYHIRLNHGEEANKLYTPYSGMYKIGVKAFAGKYDYSKLKAVTAPADAERVVSLISGSQTNTIVHDTFTLPVNKCDNYITKVGYIPAGGSLRLRANDLPPNPNKPPTGLPPIYDSVAIKGFMVEGPIISEWPPKSHKVLFGDLPQGKWSASMSKIKPENKYYKRNYRDRNWKRFSSKNTPVIISKNPTADAQKLISRFATKAFRRPATTEQVSVYVNLLKSQMNKGYCFQDALKSSYMAILCSPDFLYFHEKPGALDNYALANRLSYFLWKSSPDDKLMEIANSGKLTNSKVLASQVDRMLADPKSDRFVKSFINQWLDLKKFEDTEPDFDLFPEYKKDFWLKESMKDETYAYFKYLITKNLSASNIIDSNFIMANRRLAELYDLKGVKGHDVKPVKLPKNSIRGGLLTQGSVLKVTANGATTSPVKRGVWMAEKILGVHIPPPPANVPPIKTEGADVKTLQQQFAKHRENASCAACHKKIDPIGFALESFDVMGGYRENYRSLEEGKDVNGFVKLRKTIYKLNGDVDITSEYPGHGRFKTTQEFKKIVMKNKPQVVQHFLKNLITFATGAELQFTDRYVISQIMKKSAKDDGIKSLIHQVTQSRLFRYK